MQENKENIEIKENATVVSVVVKKTSPPGFRNLDFEYSPRLLYFKSMGLCTSSGSGNCISYWCLSRKFWV